MDKKLKAKWIKALTDGSHEQTKETLKDSQGYCCLGVLCDISGAGKWVGYEYHICDEFDGYTMDGDLGRPGRKLFGIPSRLESRLINMNDKGKSFKEIAKVIREKL